MGHGRSRCHWSKRMKSRLYVARISAWPASIVCEGILDLRLILAGEHLQPLPLVHACSWTLGPLILCRCCQSEPRKQQTGMTPVQQQQWPSSAADQQSSNLPDQSTCTSAVPAANIQASHCDTRPIRLCKDTELHMVLVTALYVQPDIQKPASDRTLACMLKSAWTIRSQGSAGSSF